MKCQVGWWATHTDGIQRFVELGSDRYYRMRSGWIRGWTLIPVYQ